MNAQMQLTAKTSPESSFTSVQKGQIQRMQRGENEQDEDCPKCRKGLLNLQRSSTNMAKPSSVPPIVHEVLNSIGQPLDPDTRAFMEPRFGHDFSKVRVHTDSKAAESARAVNALAYTVGQHVVFGTGQYGPYTEAGQKLLAHELTHVAQQRGRSILGVQWGIDISDPADPYEQEANRIASNLETPTVDTHAISSGILHLQAGDTDVQFPHINLQRYVAATNDSVAAAQTSKQHDSTIGSNVLENLTSEKEIQELTKRWNRLHALLEGDKEGHKYLIGIQNDQWFVSFFSNVFGGFVSMPPCDIWKKPGDLLKKAKSSLDARDIKGTSDKLVEAEKAYNESHLKFVEYRDGTISGAERSVTGLKVTAAAGAVAATVATGGIAAGAALPTIGFAGFAGMGLLGTSTAVGVVGGAYGATQEFSGQLGEKVAGRRKNFEIAPILRRSAIDAITNFVGALTGGALSTYAKKLFGSYLSKISDEALKEIGEQLGMGGPLPRDFFLTGGQQMIANFLGGVGAAPLTTAVSIVVNRIIGTSDIPDKGKFTELVIEEMIKAGAIQLFLGTVMHYFGSGTARGGTKPQPTRPSLRLIQGEGGTGTETVVTDITPVTRLPVRVSGGDPRGSVAVALEPLPSSVETVPETVTRPKPQLVFSQPKPEALSNAGTSNTPKYWFPPVTSPVTASKRMKGDEEKKLACKNLSAHAIPIRWPTPLWLFETGIGDPGSKDNTYDKPESPLLVKRGSTLYNPTRPEIGRYRTRITNPPFNIHIPAMWPIHHKLPLYLGGHGNEENAEGQYDALGNIIVSPNLVVMSPAVHAAWHRLLIDQPYGPHPGMGPSERTKDGTEFCVIDLV